jgi:hypothetical protein
MIDTLLSISAHIGAITTLNLSKNRLTSLCGLERLLNLQSVDLTQNRIEDCDEVGRLAALPHLRMLYASSGNPFVTQEQWRIKLFAALAAEGNTTVEIDGSLPSWNESRQIVREVARRPATSRRGSRLPADRVVSEPPRVTRPTQSARPSQLAPPERSASPESSDTLLPNAGPKKRRKRPKRVVELGNGHPAPSSSYFTEIASPRSLVAPPSPAPEPEDEIPKRHLRSVTETPSTSSRITSNAGQTETLGRHSMRTRKRSSILTATQAQLSAEPDEFRKRMEALRTEVGDDWLRVWGAQSEQQTAST